ncbi:hypothetical protein [Pseudomonas sp. EA_35y_Pfl2_R5]|uniref:hypothetical protein n=1 Tax=Pseudomonas sp. EA_35y_Pfl2_R5 TaxID=3088690 RepID=UPI0030DDBFB7
MNDDLIRLSDLVPEYVRYHEVSIQEAAYDLHELIENLYRECAVRLGTSMPDNVFWVGGVKSSQRSKKGYELDFGGLRKFFKALVDSPEAGSPLFNCFCRAENDYTSIPAGVVYLSKSALVEWVMAAGLEPPDFILDGNAEECSGGSEELGGFKGKELVSIRMIVSGLIELIREVHNAHAEPALDDKARKRAENIIRSASRLNNSRKNFNPYPDIVSLAEVAGVDMRKPKTLEFYAEGQ